MFLSYSRKDQAFVERLVEALTRRGLEPWVDLKGIAPTADWLDEIYTAIDNADAFVFVLSPDSIASESCQRELERAVASGKRLIPLIARRIDAADLPAALAPVQWIDLSATDALPDDVEELVAAFETDLPWVQSHTRLLTEARDWERRGRHRAQSLRGQKLRDAEAWIAQASDKSPKPTPLHREFILASRRAATRFARAMLMAVSGVCVVLVALLIWAVIERFKAETALDVAIARELAARAVSTGYQRDARLDQSMLLGIESLRRWPSLEAGLAIRRGLRLLPERISDVVSEGAVSAALFAPDGARLATASGSVVSVRTLDADGSGTRKWQYTEAIASLAFSPDGLIVASAAGATVHLRQLSTVPEIATLAHAGPVAMIAFSPRGELLATVSADRTAKLWDPRTGELRASLPHGSPVTTVAWSPDGRSLATGDSSGATLWNVATGDRVHRLEHGAPVVDLDFQPDGEWLATASGSAAVIWSLDDGRSLGPLRHRSTVNAVAFAPSGNLLATACVDYAARVWNLANGAMFRELAHQGPVNAVAFSPDGRRLATASNDRTARVWDLPAGREIARIPHQGFVTGITFSPDGRRVATAARDRLSRVRAAEGPDRRPVDAGRFQLTADGSHAFRSSADDTVEVFTLADDTTVARLPLAAVAGLAVSDDRRVVLTGGGGIVQLWAAPEGRELARFEHDGVVEVAISGDGALAATGSRDGTAIFWETAGGAVLSRLAHDNRISAIAISPDGRLAATGGFDRTVTLWEPAAGRMVRRLTVGGGVSSLAFSSDGGLLVAAISDSTVRVWETTTGELRSLVEHEFPVMSAVISEDSTRIASGSSDRTARVWDLASRRELTRIEYDNPVWSVAFGPNDDTLVTVVSEAGTPGSLRFVEALDDEALIELACRRLDRNLDGLEWIRYLARYPYRRTCDNLPLPELLLERLPERPAEQPPAP